MRFYSIFALAITLSLTFLLGNIYAGQVVFRLPELDKIEQCSIEQEKAMSGQWLVREMALIDSSVWKGLWGLFYDIENKCKIKMRVDPSTDIVNPRTKLARIEAEMLHMSANTGLLYHVNTFYNNNVKFSYITNINPVIANIIDYDKWKEDKKSIEKKNEEEKVRLVKIAEQENIKREKLKEEAWLDEKLLPIPKFDSGDAILGLNFDGQELIVSNKTSDFITILSISTYYNSKINTLTGLNIELPPDSVYTEGISSYKLISEEMNILYRIKRRDLETAKSGTTKFGFALKYKINNTDKQYYKVITCKNSDSIFR